MDIKLRKNQRVDITIPVQRFPTFQSAITLLGQGIPSGVSLSFATPTSTPRTSESVVLTLETNNLFSGGSFLITGNPAPTNPLQINLQLNETADQFELTANSKKDNASGAPLGALVQVYDLISGSLISSGTSDDSTGVVKLQVPVVYKRVSVSFTKAGYDVITKIVELPNPTTTKLVNVDAYLIKQLTTLSMKVVAQTPTSPNTSQSTDRIRVVNNNGVTIYDNTSATPSTNPRITQLSLQVEPPVYPFSYTLIYERTGHEVYVTSVRYDYNDPLKFVQVNLTPLAGNSGGGGSDSSLIVNYISSRYSNDAPLKLDLWIGAGANNMYLVPSNYTNFQYTNIVPIGMAANTTSGKAIVPRASTTSFSTVDNDGTIDADNRISNVPTGPLVKKLAVWSIMQDGVDSNGVTSIYKRLLIGKRVVTVTLSFSMIIADIQAIQIFSDPAATNKLFEFRGFSTTLQGFPTDYDDLYFVFVSRNGAFRTQKHVDLRDFDQGSFLTVAVGNLPVYNPLYGYTDLSKITLTKSKLFDFDAIPG